MSLTSFSRIKRCYHHPYLSEEDAEKLITDGPAPYWCRCKKAIYFSGPFGQAHQSGERGSWVNWVFNSIDSNFSTNNLDGKPISEADAIQLCAFGEVFNEKEEDNESRN